MKLILGVLLAAMLPGGTAVAQRDGGADAYTPPSWSATEGWDSTKSTTPSTYDGPHFGSATRNSDGLLCVTTPALLGKPQLGVTTTCYPDSAQTRAASARSARGRDPRRTTGSTD
jgi:hypothetical protein